MKGLNMINKQIIQEVKQRLVKTYKPVAIYIFGSYAWGFPTEESDLDLLVVIKSSKTKSYKRSIPGHLALHNLQISKDIIVLTKKEFLEQTNDITTLVHRIKKEGKKIF